VSWGLTSLKVDVAALKEAAKRENVVQAYSTTTKIIETAEKLQKLVEMSPDVIDFKELRRKSSD
jgi:phage terminase Nu1 subunit (DNA packaging protein)